MRFIKEILPPKDKNGLIQQMVALKQQWLNQNLNNNHLNQIDFI